MITPCKQLLLLAINFSSEILECLLDLPFGHIILFIKPTNLLLHLAFLNKQSLNITLKAVQVSINL